MKKEIRKYVKKFKIGVSMEELAEEFNLSVETIKKIIYKK